MAIVTSATAHLMMQITAAIDRQILRDMCFIPDWFEDGPFGVIAASLIHKRNYGTREEHYANYVD